MNIENVKKIANRELSYALSQCGMKDVFKVVPGGTLSAELDEAHSIEYEIIFTYGNLKHNHAIIVGWNDTDGVGLEYGEDGDIMPITYGTVMASMYFDMAMTGLDDKFIA